MTRLLLLLALALGFLLALRRREPVRAPARWLEDDDGVLAPDPRTVGLLEAAVAWNHLEAQPGFNEAIREGERQIAEGRSVQFGSWWTP